MATIRKRKLPSGKIVWQASYQDQSGRRRSRQFDLRKDAEGYLDQAKAEVRKGVHTPDSLSTSVKDACDGWIASVERNRRERTTVDQYRGHVNNHIVPQLGAEKLSRLTTPRVVAFVDAMLDAGVSRQTARKVLTSLKGAISDAQRRGLVAQNVAAPVKVDTRSEDREDGEALIPPREDVALILDKAPDAYRPLLVTAALCGLRPSELRGLTWDGVDFEGRCIRVRQRADARNRIGKPKTRTSNRDVPMSPMVVNTLKAWKLACPKGRAGLVFPNGLGKPLHITDLSRRVWTPLLKACGLLKEDGGTPYQFKHLRHFAASLWIKGGANPKWVQRTMGHSSIRVTLDIYARLWRDQEEDQGFATAAENLLSAARCNTDATRGR